MKVEIRSQRIAQAAFARIDTRAGESEAEKKKYLSFARSFPTLIHTSGLAQAAAFALAKGDEKLKVLDDLADVLNATDASWQLSGGKGLDKSAREETDVLVYTRLTRQSLQSATWLKRYAEALLAPTAAERDHAESPS